MYIPIGKNVGTVAATRTILFDDNRTIETPDGKVFVRTIMIRWACEGHTTYEYKHEQTQPGDPDGTDDPAVYKHHLMNAYSDTDAIRTAVHNHDLAVESLMPQFE